MSGVGTEIAKLIPDWAVADKKGCKCKSMAAKWDKYGIAWCERNVNIMVAHLLGESERLIPAMHKMPESLKRLAAIQMIKVAIKRAKA